MIDNKKRLTKNILISVACPIILFVLLEVLCKVMAGSDLITSKNYMMVIRNFASLTCLGMGLACNITSGRFDFSLGAVMVAAAIIGGNIALRLGFGGIGVLIASILFGMLLSGIVGVMYTIAKISTIVLSLGMALIIESLGFLVFNSEGLNLIRVKTRVEILSNPVFMIVIVLVVVIIMSIISEKTAFGFHQRALSSGQSVSVFAGIKENKNAIICYSLSGGFFAIGGVINASYKGILQPALGLSSVASVFISMLPVFVGGFLARFSNDTIGKLVASIMVSLLNAFMITLGFSDTEQSFVNAVILIVFLMIIFNLKEIASFGKMKKLTKNALQLRHQ